MYLEYQKKKILRNHRNQKRVAKHLKLLKKENMWTKNSICRKLSFENKDKRTFSGKIKPRDFVGRDQYYKNAKGSSLA